MPKRLHIENHLSLDELKQRYLNCQKVRERTRWQAILLLAQGTPSEYVANATHYSLKWVRQLAGRYNRQGPITLADQRHQHPGPKRLLNPLQLQALQGALEQAVPEACGGGLWNGPKVAAWMSHTLGRSVAPRQGRVYLRAAGYRGQRPRPYHAQGDAVAQVAFKKT